jgi:hypothetical protein
MTIATSNAEFGLDAKDIRGLTAALPPSSAERLCLSVTSLHFDEAAPPSLRGAAPPSDLVLVHGKAKPFRTGGRHSRWNNLEYNLFMASINLLLDHFELDKLIFASAHICLSLSLLSRYHT